MKRLLCVAVVGITSVIAPAAAHADHDYYEDGYGSEYDSRDSGGNYGQNRREEEYGHGSCKYFCPAFDRSPVEDSFNICLPGSTCNFDGRRDGQEEGQPEGR